MDTYAPRSECCWVDVDNGSLTVKDVCDLMKRSGFVFSTTRSPVGQSAYVRKLTANAINTAKWLRPQLDKLLTGE